MNKIAVAILLLVLVGVATWWLVFRDADVELSFTADWPSSVRAVGEATERIVSSPDGEATEGDRARAVERARWKAYYYAQLRLAEQVGGLQIDATTTVRDMELVDQELKAAFSDTVRAAREVEAESSVEDLGDTVRARVVVEAPPEKVTGLGALIVAAMKSGRISRKPAEEPAVSAPLADEPDLAAEPEQVTETTERETVSLNDVGSSSGSGNVSEPQAPDHTGCTVVLDSSSEFVGAAPDFYDGAGTLLGSALDLPVERLTAGIVLATSFDTALIEENAGARPKSFQGTVSRGNVILDDVLDSNEASFFKTWLRGGRVVLVLGEEG